MGSGIDRSKLSDSLSEIQERLEFLRTRCIGDPGNFKEILSDAQEQLQATFEELSAANGEFMQDGEDFLDAKKATIKSSAGFRLLAEFIPHLIWSARPDGVSDYYNARFLNYLGKTLDQMQGWSWVETLHPDDRQRSLDAWKEAFTNGREYQIEYRIHRAVDGQYRWHLGHALPLRDINGQIVRWLGTCTDIHDCKQMEEELLRSRYELEQGVMKRTEELSRANLTLQVEAVERKRAEEMMCLQRDLGVALSSAGDLTEALNLILDACLMVRGIDCGGVYMVDESSGDLKLVAHTNTGLPSQLLAEMIEREKKARLIEYLKEIADEGDFVELPP